MLLLWCILVFSVHPLLFVFESRHNKTNKVSVRLAKTQISLSIRPVWSESSLSARRKLGSFASQWAHSEDSHQTGRTLILLVLSCRASFRIALWLSAWMAICLKRAVLLAFHLCWLTLCRLNCLYFFFLVWCLGQDVEFGYIGSWALLFVCFVFTVYGTAFN